TQGAPSSTRPGLTIRVTFRPIMLTTAPRQTLVVFDAECPFCIGWIAFLAHRDPHRLLRFAPWRSDAARRVLASFGVGPNALAGVTLVVDDRLYTRSDAVLQICRLLGLPWSLLSLLAITPRPVRDLAYSVVARNRYRLAQRGTSSDLADPAVQSRLLQ
ncbi:MAG TPA: DCC1-like thiol-disulfide oxidoreductase family protein, partial [Candidatus Sulfotelmatobacter sp.]|nr:DCC1-like thiol-disulfide oxidoreductase family protein [Candidatus Sulfotelmatobacter sp.]